MIIYHVIGYYYMQGLGIILENMMLRQTCNQLQGVLTRYLDFMHKCTKWYCHHLYKSHYIPQISFQSAIIPVLIKCTQMQFETYWYRIVYFERQKQKMCALWWNCKMLSDYKQSNSFTGQGLIKPQWNIKCTTFYVCVCVCL